MNKVIIQYNGKEEYIDIHGRFIAHDGDKIEVDEKEVAMFLKDKRFSKESKKHKKVGE